MTQHDDSVTRVQSDAGGTADDATRLHSPSGAGDATRVATTSPRPSDAALDPPTRLSDSGVTSAAPSRPALAETQLATGIAGAAQPSPPSPHLLEPGSLIKNRFLLVEELGRGGMGVVYSARDLVHEEAGKSDAWVAIKLLSDDFKDHPEALRMLQQETKKSRELAHPNIVTVYDFDRDGDLVYMTMELLSGQSLDVYLKEHQYETADLSGVIPIITDIAQGLMYAHKGDIIHSDLKPSNIFLTDKGAKILDFGIARAAQQSDKDTDEEAFIALTPSYASLEMFLGEPPDPRDDIYAFACICYQLLATAHPYRKRSAEEALEQGLTPERINSLKERQWQGLLQGLALKREQRTPTVDAFIEALLPKRREPWKLASIFLGVLTLLSGGYYFFRPTVIVAPSLFENPPPEAELTTQQRSAVEAALEVAEVHMMVGRLLNPPGGNALDEYRKVLEMHPYNRQAIAGMEALMQQLLEQAMAAQAAGDLPHARQLVQEGLKIHAKHEGLLALQEQLGPATQAPGPGD